MNRLSSITAHVFFACVVAVATPALRAQTLDVAPSVVMMDQSARIRAIGLRANERVTIEAQLTDGGDVEWTSRADFLAGQDGTVDVSQQAPVAGSYKDISAMGLVWSMKPKAKDVPYRSQPRLGAQKIEFRLLRSGQQVAAAHLEQRVLAEGVRPLRLEGTLHGFLYLPPGAGRHPGVLVLGGSEGGAPFQKAAWLASHGFAALALAYFRFDDLPEQLESIPLEYFGTALGWLMQRPEVQPDQIAVVGTSRGGELALQLASMYPQIRAVVAYVPANVRYPGCCQGARMMASWTWKGRPLAFADPRPNRPPDASINAAIPVEQTHGPIMVIAGEDDGVWPSSMMANAIAGRLKQQHFEYPVEVLKYPGAGHRVGRPEFVPAWHGTMRHPVSGREVDIGGTPRGDALSSIDATPRVVEFLHRSLDAQAAGQ